MESVSSNEGSEEAAWDTELCTCEFFLSVPDNFKLTDRALKNSRVDLFTERNLDFNEGSKEAACVSECTCEYLSDTDNVILTDRELKGVRMDLFTERNSDGTRYLVLRGNDLYSRFQKRVVDLDISPICKYIHISRQRITRLDLSYNHMTDVGFLTLLNDCTTIINLNVMNNELTCVSMENFASYAKIVTWKCLRINGNKIGDQGAIYFASFLRDNETLEYADIGETDITLLGVAHIFAALSRGGNTTLKVFDISRIVRAFDRYPSQTKWLAYHLELLLQDNKTLIEIHVQKNELSAHDMEYIARGLRDNQTLLYLDLGYNHIADNGAQLLAEYLRSKPPLLFLNIAGNSISDAGARALSFGMPFSKIRAFDISHNKLTGCGVLDILHSLKKAYYMRFLNLWGNQITHEACLVLKRMFAAGSLFQHTSDVTLYEADGKLYAAYNPNPADKNKHRYYCQMDYACSQELRLKKNKIKNKTVKLDCKQRRKLDKTDKTQF